jgi:hypothetical protein
LISLPAEAPPPLSHLHQGEVSTLRTAFHACTFAFATRFQPAFKTHVLSSALHAQHWWFSGKIGRCQQESPTLDDIGQPRVRFPADACTLTTRGLPFASCVSDLLRLEKNTEVSADLASEVSPTFSIRRTDVDEEKRFRLSGHGLLQSVSWIGLFLRLARPACRPRVPVPPLPSSDPRLDVSSRNILYLSDPKKLGFLDPIFEQLSSSIGGLVVKLAVAI